MTERDDIAFGTPEAELLGAAAFDGGRPPPSSSPSGASPRAGRGRCAECPMKQSSML